MEQMTRFACRPGKECGLWDGANRFYDGRQRLAAARGPWKVCQFAACFKSSAMLQAPTDDVVRGRLKGKR